MQTPFKLLVKPLCRESLLKGKYHISTIDLLLLLSIIANISNKTSYLNVEVNHSEPSPSVIVHCLLCVTVAG